jgi:hypothetical protein
MTPEEIEALKKRAEDAETAAEVAKKEAETQKKAAEDAEAVNKTLQEQLVKVTQEAKPELPTLKVGNKKGVFVYPKFKLGNEELTPKDVIESKDEKQIKALIDAQVIIIQ